MSNAKTPKITTAFADTLTVVGNLESLAKAIRWHAILDMNRIAALCNKGVGRKRIATEMGVGVGTIYRVSLDGSKIREKVFEPDTGCFTLWSRTRMTLHREGYTDYNLEGAAGDDHIQRLLTKPGSRGRDYVVAVRFVAALLNALLIAFAKVPSEAIAHCP